MFKKMALLSGLVLSTLTATVVSAAGDAVAGKTKAVLCAGCHGLDGISIMPMYPNLKGQKSTYTAKQLKAFKDKTRVDPIMAGMAASLTDADISNLAAYYESLK